MSDLIKSDHGAPPTTQELQDLSHEMTRGWSHVSRDLGITDEELYSIQKNCQGQEQEAIFQMLLLWKQKGGLTATRIKLAIALHNNGREDLSGYILAVQPKNSQMPPKEDPKKVTGSVSLPHYSMSRKPRGKCLILTYDKFKEASKRIGNKVDMVKLEEIFETTLEFDVENELNLDSERTRQLIQETAKSDHTHYDCFVCFICSHGDGEAFLTKDEGKITIQEILTPFKAGNCKSLAGKPKIFLINTCLGDAYQRMVKFQKNGPNMPPDTGIASNLTNYAPNEADFCVVLSTVPGYASLRDAKKGTLFVQSFYDCLKEKYEDHHLVDILTLVNSDVNSKFEEIANQQGSKEYPVGQVSTLLQTLNKAIYFSVR